MRLPHIGVIALVDQIFFGRDVIIEAGFGKPQSAGHIGEGSGARALGVKELRCTGQHRRALGLALQTTTEWRAIGGDEVSKISVSNAGPKGGAFSNSII